MKKAIIFFCCILTIATSAVFPAAASYNDEIDLDAEIALLVSLDNGTVIFDKNAEKRTAPASLTKLKTALTWKTPSLPPPMMQSMRWMEQAAPLSASRKASRSACSTCFTA